MMVIMGKNNNKIFVLYYLIFLGALANSSLKAQTSFLGVRAIGMGTAMVSVADDENTFYFNPAGLNFLEKNYVTVLLNFQGVSDKNSLKIYQFMRNEGENIENVLDNLNITDEDFYKKLINLSENIASTFISNRLFEVISPKIGVGLYNELFSQYLLDTLNVSSQPNPKLQIPFNTTIRSTLMLGYAKNLFLNNHISFSFGASFAYFVTHSLSQQKIINNSKDFKAFFLFRKPSINKIYHDSLLNHGLRVNVGSLLRLNKYTSLV